MTMTEPSTTGAIAAPWEAYEPSDASPWNRRRVVHLHRRAGFGAPWSQIERDLADGPQASIDRLLAGKSSAKPASEGFDEMSRVIAEAALASENPNRLKAWWLYRLLVSPDPLTERLTLTWHNHFATSNRKVQNLKLMHEQNEILRKHARSQFGDLLSAVVKHPAMLLWLDADSNRAGHPNENLARELMELFTLGIGEYQENDVKEAARALTGWAVVSDKFEVRTQRHDDGTKTVLDNSEVRTGDDLLALLVSRAATSQRIAWRLCRTFFGENVVDEAAQEELAAGLREKQFDIGWAVERIVRSRLFFSEANIGSRVAGPVDYVVSTLRALECADPPPSTLVLAEWVTRIGQDLFYPPNVGGWGEGRAWLSSQAFVARANFAQALVSGQLARPAVPPDLAQLAARHGASGDAAAALAWFAELFWGHAPEGAVAGFAPATSSDGGVNGTVLNAAVARLLARPEAQLH
jgi:uncharacterized protein (DUF1800 family)